MAHEQNVNLEGDAQSSQKGQGLYTPNLSVLWREKETSTVKLWYDIRLNLNAISGPLITEMIFSTPFTALVEGSEWIYSERLQAN